MEIWHLWVIGGVVLAILELVTPGFLLASLAAGCFGAAVGAALSASFTIQLSMFSAGTIVFFFVVTPIVRKYLTENDREKQTGVDALIGKTGTVVERIDNSNNRGRVRIGGETWKAAAESGTTIPENEKVVIRRLEGVTVFVEKPKTEDYT